MIFRVEITDVQHVRALSLDIDLSKNRLTCIVGKNGSGKTTLVKAIRTISLADTFARTSSGNIFQPSSSIRYWFDSQIFAFEYDSNIRGLNCKSAIPNEIKSLIEVELPVPTSPRF